MHRHLSGILEVASKKKSDHFVSRLLCNGEGCVLVADPACHELSTLHNSPFPGRSPSSSVYAICNETTLYRCLASDATRSLVSRLLFMTIIEHIGTTYVILRRSMMLPIRQRSSVLLNCGEADSTLQNIIDLVRLKLVLRMYVSLSTFSTCEAKRSCHF